MSQALATTGSSGLELHRDGDSSEFATFYIGAQMFGIPILKVQDILQTDRIAPIPLSPMSVHGSINLRGRIVTVIDVHTCLGLKPLDVAAIDVGMPKDEKSVPLVSESQKKIVQATFAKISSDGEQFSQDFFNALFEAHPELKELFKGDFQGQNKKFINMLKSIVIGLDSPEKLKPVLVVLGKRHTDDYQVHNDHYAIFGETLLSTIETTLGREFTVEVKDSWASVYRFAISLMTSGGDKISSNGPVAKAHTHTGVTVEKDHDLYTLLVDKIGDVMVVDDSIFESNPGTLDPKWRDYTLGVYRLDKELLVVLDVDKLLDTNR